MNEHDTTPHVVNYGYELIAFTTALLLVVFIGLIPTLASANFKQLPFCFIGMAFVLGALLAYHHEHHGRFWAFIVAAVLIVLGF
jgi:inner membrane protein involved in colicin E2 resistance